MDQDFLEIFVFNECDLVIYLQEDRGWEGSLRQLGMGW